MASRQPFLHDLVVTLRATTVCLSGVDGQIRGQGVQGVLAADVRVLAEAVVTVNGVEPTPIAHGSRGASTAYFVGLPRELGDSEHDPTVWLRRDRTVLADGLRETFTLVNRSSRDLTAELALRVGTDLAAIETIKAGAPVGPLQQRDPPATRSGHCAVTLCAPGAAVGVGVPAPGFAITAVSASGTSAAQPSGGSTVAAAVLRWSVAVPAGSSTTREWTLSVRDDGAVVAPTSTRLRRPLAVTADDPRLAALLDRALDDLDALLLTEPGHPADVFAGAGAPWYFTLFGRDSLWTATLLLPFDVGLAGGTLRTLARSQGRVDDPAIDEEPGKILHERRRLPDGAAGRLPPRYYGTVDATSLWICLLHDAWRWGLPADDVRALLPNLDAALGWLARSAGGFVAYHNPTGRGLANQGWKDSADAVRFADGRRAVGPVALAEVQAYAYKAALAAATLLDAFGDSDGGARSGDVAHGGPGWWRAYAADLAARFRERFWVADADGRYPALALDGADTPVDAPTSNIGHLLGTGLLDGAESAAVAQRLLAPEMTSGFGLRTMSRGAGGYSPLSYHCGSVWPHDTAIAARGLAHAGNAEAAATFAAQLLTATDAFDRRLPELFGGFGADEVDAPVPYPASCHPQAWSAAAAVEMLRVLLGLTVDVPAKTITLRPPSPSPVGAVAVRGLAVGSGLLDVAIDRDGRVTHAHAPPGFTVHPTR